MKAAGTKKTINLIVSYNNHTLTPSSVSTVTVVWVIKGLVSHRDDLLFPVMWLLVIDQWSALCPQFMQGQTHCCVSQRDTSCLLSSAPPLPCPCEKRNHKLKHNDGKQRRYSETPWQHLWQEVYFNNHELPLPTSSGRDSNPRSQQDTRQDAVSAADKPSCQLARGQTAADRSAGLLPPVRPLWTPAEGEEEGTVKVFYVHTWNQHSPQSTSSHLPSINVPVFPKVLGYLLRFHVTSH